jgi:hypothetical protein
VGVGVGVGVSVSDGVEERVAEGGGAVWVSDGSIEVGVGGIVMRATAVGSGSVVIKAPSVAYTASTAPTKPVTTNHCPRLQRRIGPTIKRRTSKIKFQDSNLKIQTHPQ